MDIVKELLSHGAPVDLPSYVSINCFFLLFTLSKHKSKCNTSEPIVCINCRTIIYFVIYDSYQLFHFVLKFKKRKPIAKKWLVNGDFVIQFLFFSYRTVEHHFSLLVNVITLKLLTVF